MTSKAKPSARTRYTPDQRTDILTWAKNYMACGLGQKATAKKLNISPTTLRKWLAEEVVEQSDEEEQCDSCEHYTWEAECKPRDGGPEPTAEKKLSWREVQELCREREEHEHKIDSLSHPIYSLQCGDTPPQHCDGSGRLFISHSAIIAAEGLERRMKEIEVLVGQDALDEYKQRKTLTDRVDNLRQDVAVLERHVSTMAVRIGGSAFAVAVLVFAAFILPIILS